MSGKYNAKDSSKSKSSSAVHALKSVGKVESVTMMVLTNSLIPSMWNPPIRTQLSEMSNLVDSMRTRGFLPQLPILAAAENSMIIDGHRRHTAAMFLQIPEVPVTVMEGDPGDLWAMINGTRATVTGRQVMQAVNRGLTSIPANYSKLIARLREVVGDEDLKKLDVSPFIINHAGQIAKYCGHEGEREFTKQIVLWLAKWPQVTTLTKAAMRESASPTEIERAILRNQPLQRSYKG